MKESNKTAKLGHCLVTGGAGFLGRNLVGRLLDMGCKVTIFDRVKSSMQHENLTVLVGDITDQQALSDAMKGIDCIFHTAAVIELGGGSAATESYRQPSMQINVEGTEKVIAAARLNGVGRIVYTSSNAVCYNGKPITNMTSDTPYASNIYDLYTESKILAEKAVLAANGSDGLFTTAIRPSGIYGAESCVMIDKFVQEVAAGKLVAALGTPNAVHENVYIDNLVHAQILAAERLVEGNRCCGRAYFISDNEFQNYFDFFRPLIDGLGYTCPRVFIPMWLLMPFMQLGQWLHFRFGFPAPLLRPKELDKVCTTHISDFREPARDLDYEPLINVEQAMEKCLVYCKNLHDQIKLEKA